MFITEVYSFEIEEKMVDDSNARRTYQLFVSLYFSVSLAS